MNGNAEKAVAMFGQGFNCAQAVLTCCGEPGGLPRDTAIRLAGPFGGGMGCLGETCGAVTGAFMVIGLMHTRVDPKDAAAKQQVYQLVRQFAARFAERNKTICCRELLGCDISTPEGIQQARDKGLFKTICPKVVGDAAEIVEELLSNANGGAK